MTVVIGSQTNVPATGDPILSPWHQDTARKIVHVFASTTARDAWIAPPNGAVCQAPPGRWWTYLTGTGWNLMSVGVETGRGSYPQTLRPAPGAADLITVIDGTTRPYPVQMQALAVVTFGFGSGTFAKAACDIYRLNDSTASGTLSMIHQTPAGISQDMSALWGWTVAAGGDLGYRVRFNGTDFSGGNCYVSAFTTWWATPQP